jgi:hypothetical protein
MSHIDCHKISHLKCFSSIYLYIRIRLRKKILNTYCIKKPIQLQAECTFVFIFLVLTYFIIYFDKNQIHNTYDT